MSFCCRTCDHRFDDPDLRRVCDGPSEFWGVREITYSAIEICPECRSSDLEEYSPCDIEGCVEPHVTGHDYCQRHLAEVLLEDQYYEDPRENIELAGGAGGVA